MDKSPSVLLVNVQPLDDKLDEFSSRLSYQRDLSLIYNPVAEQGAPQGCVLSPLLYSLFTHNWVAAHDLNTIIKIADDETACREEIRDSNISLNVSKTKELIMDYRKGKAKYVLIHIDGAVMETVESFKFFCVHNTKDLSWSKHNNKVVKKV